MDLSQRGVIHTICCLNIGKAICPRQKGRQDVMRIQLLSWLHSLGNTSCPHGIKHAKLSAVSIPPSCPLIDSRSAGVVHCQNGELDSGMLAEARWERLRGKERKGKGRETERGQSGARERREALAQWIYGSRSVPKHTCDTNAQGRDRCRIECWVAACHAPILQFTPSSRESKRKFVLQKVR